MRELGYAGIIVGLLLAAAGTVLAAVMTRRAGRAPEYLRSITYAVAGLLTVSTVAMVLALVTNDFSVSYVAQVGSRATPIDIKIISLWSALEGSILFWGWVLALYAAAVVYTQRHRDDAAIGYATGTLLGELTYFLLQMALWLAGAAGIAVYGSHRLESLRQEASAARRLGSSLRGLGRLQADVRAELLLDGGDVVGLAGAAHDLALDLTEALAVGADLVGDDDEVDDRPTDEEEGDAEQDDQVRTLAHGGPPRLSTCAGAAHVPGGRARGRCPPTGSSSCSGRPSRSTGRAGGRRGTCTRPARR